MRQIQRKEMGLLLNAADNHDRFAEVGLSMARCVRKRHKHLPMSATVLPNIVLDDGVSARKTVLIAKPLEDPLGRMPLLSRPIPILGKQLIDDPGEPVQLRALDRR